MTKGAVHVDPYTGTAIGGDQAEAAVLPRKTEIASWFRLRLLWVFLEITSYVQSVLDRPRLKFAVYTYLS